MPGHTGHGYSPKSPRENSPAACLKHPCVFHLCDIHVKGGDAFPSTSLQETESLSPGSADRRVLQAWPAMDIFPPARMPACCPSWMVLKPSSPVVPNSSSLLHIEGCKNRPDQCSHKILHILEHTMGSEGETRFKNTLNTECRFVMSSHPISNLGIFLHQVKSRYFRFGNCHSPPRTQKTASSLCESKHSGATAPARTGIPRQIIMKN